MFGLGRLPRRAPFGAWRDEAHVAQRLQRMVSQALGQGSDSAFLDARLWGPR